MFYLSLTGRFLGFFQYVTARDDMVADSRACCFLPERECFPEADNVAGTY